jgi:hypothetical protein
VWCAGILLNNPIIQDFAFKGKAQMNILDISSIKARPPVSRWLFRSD